MIIRPKSNETIQFMNNLGEVVKAKVLSSQAKRAGKWKDWLNIHVCGDEEPISIDWNTIQWWRRLGEQYQEQVLVLSVTDGCQQDVFDAKCAELKSLEDNSVFEWVEDSGQKVISSRWIITEKQNPDGTKRLKGRLVARGFEESLEDKRVDSPTCSRIALRILFVIASSKQWELHSLDVTAAFLQGKQLTRDVFVRPPRDICRTGMVWKLKRCLYGLSDAPREWYDRVKEKLMELNGIVCLYDNAMFLWQDSCELFGVIVLHVDDFLFCGTLRWHDLVIRELVETFKISKRECGAFRYIGLDIMQTEKGIFVNQNAYVKNLQEIVIDAERKSQIDSQLTRSEKDVLGSVSGKLLWASSQTRPDIAFETCQLSNSGPDATVRAFLSANKAIRKARNCSFSLIFPPLGEPQNLKVTVYGDASHGALPNGASQGGSVVFLEGGGRCAAISWQSKKLDRVTKSPLASEISAIADASDSGYLVASIVKQVFCLTMLPQIELVTDSKSLKDHLERKRVINDPRLRVDMGRLREMIELGEVTVDWVRGGSQIANPLTKRGASSELLVKVLSKGAF